MTERSVKEYISEISQMIHASAQNYSIWWNLKNKENREKHIETMNMYSSYFLSAINAHFVATIIPIYCLYEDRKDTYNFIRLIDLVRAEGRLTAANEAKLAEYMPKAKSVWEKIKVLRNRAFGHRSKAHKISELFSIARITPNEIRDIIDLSERILNVLSVAHDGSSYAFNLKDASGEDVVAMLENLATFHGRATA